MTEAIENILSLTNDKIINRFADKIISVERAYDFPVYTISKDIIIDFLAFLFNEEQLEYQFLTTLCGIHYPDAKEQIGVVYHLHSLKNNARIRVKSFTNIDHPVFPTATKIFAAANWMERETYDFFGIIFDGHPNLKRILNVDEMDYFPMRKEYPLEDQTRDDKDNSFFGR